MSLGEKDKKIIIFLTIPLIIFVALLFHPKPQPLWYHNFADKRTIFGIPYFTNVITNIPFLIIGFWGITRVYFSQKPFQKALFYFIFTTSILIGLGSAYYHLYPSNDTLFFDRMAMSLALTSLPCVILGERSNGNFWKFLFFFLLFIGTTSTAYWSYTEELGIGDIRPYIASSSLCLLIMFEGLILFNEKHTNQKYWVLILLSLAAAKLCEFSDKLVYFMTFTLIGGHAFKHLFSALAFYYLLRYFEQRKPLCSPYDANCDMAKND